MDFKLDKGSTHMSQKGCTKVQNNKLNTYDWLCDVPDALNATKFVEVQFKNTRKGYYENSENLELHKGDKVAVESNPGHDIGTVTLTGKLVALQMKKCRVRTDVPPKKIYRLATENDLEKCEAAKAREHTTMIRSRQIAADLKLNMKIGDVEYQGDGNKAIFYYIADERVDFRQLIKVLAEAFRVRIEMKQIGARQEAGRIGGIGSCGRELCCSKWMSNFVSVSTGAARIQDISMNPQKLAGQCAKLKCCINYEVDGYVEARKRLPSPEIELETKDCTYYHFKTDVFKGEITYSTDKHIPANLVTIAAKRAFAIIGMNRRGNKPLALSADEPQEPVRRDALDILDKEGLTRFDGSSSKNKKKRRNNNKAHSKDRFNKKENVNKEESKDSVEKNDQPRESRNKSNRFNRNKNRDRVQDSKNGNNNNDREKRNSRDEENQNDKGQRKSREINNRNKERGPRRPKEEGNKEQHPRDEDNKNNNQRRNNTQNRRKPRNRNNNREAKNNEAKKDSSSSNE